MVVFQLIPVYNNDGVYHITKGGVSMKMKQVLAFALAGTLCLSNSAWAGNYVTPVMRNQSQENQESRATQSNADPKATESNAVIYDEKLQSRAKAEKNITWEGAEKLYCGDAYYLWITNHEEENVFVNVEVTGPDNTVKNGFYSPYELRAGTRTLASVNSYLFQEPGQYTFRLVDSNDPAITYGEPIEKEAVNMPFVSLKNVTISFDGNEKTISVSELLPFAEDRKLESVTLSQLSEEEREKYSSLPEVIDKTSVRFTLKQSEDLYACEIPLEITCEDGYQAHSSLRINKQRVNLVQQRTKEEIRRRLLSRPFSMDQEDTWAVAPDPGNETSGELSQETQENTLNALNFIR